jgi:hypothetical protein
MIYPKMIYLCGISDGINFNNSRPLNIWGFNERHLKSISSFNNNTILCFIKKGGIVVGIAYFESYKNIKDEPLLNIETENNDNLGWIDYDKYPIQIKYLNFIEIKNLKYKNKLSQCSLFKYDREKHKFNKYDLETIIDIKYNV